MCPKHAYMGEPLWYLIEYAARDDEPASWWTGLWFTSNVNHAARFPLKSHAEVAMRRLEIQEYMDRSRLSVTEHRWVASPRRSAP